MENKSNKNKRVNEIMVFTILDDQVRVTKKGILNLEIEIITNGKKTKKILRHDDEKERDLTFDLFDIRQAKNLLKYIDRGN